MKHLKSLTTQAGSAIITALMIVALCAGLMMLMQVEHRSMIARTSHVVSGVKMAEQAQRVKLWAVNTLTNYLRAPNERKATWRWPQVMPQINDNGMVITGEIVDAQARFNVNNLQESSFIAGFNHFVTQQLGTENKTNLGRAIGEFIAKGNSQTTAIQYGNKNRPYRMKHRELADVSELNLVAGFTPENYRRLSPYLIALPGTTLLNVNTADAPTLQTLDRQMTPALVEQIISERKLRGGFRNLSDVQTLLTGAGLRLNNFAIALSSTTFIVRATVKKDELTRNLFWIMKLSGGVGEQKITVLAKTIAVD